MKTKPNAAGRITRRARCYENDIARFRRWKATSSALELVEVRSKFGLPTRYLIITRLPCGAERILSRHRQRRAAERRLTKIAKSNSAQQASA